MATEFIATVKSAGGDYTSLSAAEAGLNNDLTLSTIKVFSISTSAGTIGASVTGQTSGATGTLVLKNAAGTQVLIKSIVGTFQSGEVVQSSGGNSVTLSDAGASPIVRIDCYDLGAADTTKVVIDGWTTSATNYIRIRVPDTDRHHGARSTSKYRLVPNASNDYSLIINEDYVRIEGLQISSSASSTEAGVLIAAGATSDVRLIDVLVYDIVGNSGGGTRGDGFLANTGTSTWLNCAVYNCSGGASNCGFHVRAGGTVQGNAYNCVASACAIGFHADNRTLVATNCYSGGTSGNDFQNTSGTLTLTTCYSEDGTASTTAAAYSTSSGGYFTSVTSGSQNLHIGTSSTLKGAGTDLSATFATNHPGGSVDVDGEARTVPWDIGIDEYTPIAGTPPAFVSASILNNGHTGTLAAGAATTATLAAGASATTDFYKSAVLQITKSGFSQFRKITAYNGSTKVATVAAWDTTPDNTYTYIVHSGTHLSITFDRASDYNAGVATVNATPILGQTAKRTIPTVGSPVRGDGTATHVYTLRTSEQAAGLGMPVNSGETVTVDLPADLARDTGTITGNASSSANAVTNSSAFSYAPHIRRASPRDLYITGGSYIIEVEAMHGLSGSAGDGLSSVTYTISDGSHSDVTGSLTRRAGYDGYVLYGATANISTLNDGLLTVTVTATSDSGMGTRSDAWTIPNNSNGTLAIGSYFVDGSGGSDSNSGTTGSPFATIGKATTAARLASKTGCYVNIKTAGTYIPSAGADGNDFNNTYPIYIRPDPAGSLTRAQVVLRGAAANNGGVRAYQGTGRAVYSGLTINVSLTDAVENVCVLGIGTIYNCRVTHNDNPDPALPSGAITPFISTGSYDVIDTTMDKMATAIAKGVALGRNLDITNCGGDVITTWSGLICNYRMSYRGMGRVAFTCRYTAAGPATIAKTGTSGAGSLVLVDPANGTTTLDLTSASYDTWTEVVSKINTLTNWTATLVEDKYASDLIWPFSAVSALTAQTIYQTSTFHSDGIQQTAATGGPTLTNLMISGGRCTAQIDHTTTHLGLTNDLQTIWMDNAGPPDIEGLAIVNVSDPTFDTTFTNRSAFHGNLRNCLIAFNSFPYTKFSLMYAGGGGVAGAEFQPTNFIFAYNVTRQLNVEGSGTGADIFVRDNNWTTTGDVAGTESTTGSPSAEFVSVAGPASFSLRPLAAGDLNSRYPHAVTLADASGTARTGTAVGAFDTVPTATATTGRAPRVSRVSRINRV